MAKKNAAKGPRLPLDFGSVQKKVAGKKVTQKAYGRIIESAAKALGLKTADPKKIAGKTTKKNKKGSLYLSGQSVTKHGTTVLASTGETRKNKKGQQVMVWHRLMVPQGISLAKASAVLAKGKVRYIKFPGGEAQPIGKGGK